MAKDALISSYFQKPAESKPTKAKAPPKAKPRPKPKAKSDNSENEDNAGMEESSVYADSDEGGGEPSSEAGDEDILSDNDDLLEDEEEERAPKAASRKKKPTVTSTGAKDSGVPYESNLPPISNIPDMFKDMVDRIPAIIDVAKHIKGRPLRVATMCSGTESPLLALGLISRALREDHGTSFEIEHVFSCEIEPFKQAYIERNFHPPILFKDVCELNGKEA